MKILDHLPIAQADSLVYVGAEPVRLKRDEIIVWVSVTLEKVVDWQAGISRFPAIIDTGHTHNFAIQQQHLQRWGRVDSKTIRTLGHIRHDGRRMPLLELNVWLHRNQAGAMTPSSEEPLLLQLVHGVAVYPDAAKYPRLPILGTRAIVSNNLHLAIDGEHASVTLRTPDWRTGLLTWLA